MARHWIFRLLIIAFVWVVVSRFTEIEKLAETLARGQWEWILAAALTQVVYYLVYSALYQAAFHTVGVKSRTRDLAPVTLGAVFVNVVAPTGGTAAVALFADDAARRGQSPARAAVGALLAFVADLVAFTGVLLVGLVYLFRQHDLRAYELLGAAVLLLLIGGLSGVLLLGLWQPDRLRRWLAWTQRTVQRFAGRFRRPSPLADDWAEKHATEFTEAALAIATYPQRLGRALALGLAIHLIDLTCLTTLFLAFHQPVRFGPLVAGYAMGILFWIVSPTPQGIGVVEGVMALVYTSLGVPAATATVIALAFRGLTFWLPLALGFLVLRRVKSFSEEDRARREVWSVRAAAWLTAGMGVINLLSAATPPLAHRLAVAARFFPLEVRHGGHLTAALAGFALLLLAGNLWRRKRVAWVLTLMALSVSIVSHLLKGLDYEEALLAAGLAVWLAFLGPHFHAHSDRPSVRQGLGVLAGALGFTLLYGVTGFYLLDRHFSVNFGLGAALRQTVVMFTQFYDPGPYPITGFGRYFADSIYTVGATTLGYALVLLVRPVLIRAPATPDEQARAQALVEAHGRSSLARFTLFEDKSYSFSPGGSLVAFAVKGRIALALGDPIGPDEDAAAALAHFQATCARNDWQPAFFQATPDYLPHYQAAGFSALCVGHEAIVDLATFTLEGKAGKTLRTPINRLTRLGYRAEVHEPPLSDELLSELRAVSDEWLTMMHGTEKRFALGWFDDDYLRNAPVLAVHGPDGGIMAFANLVPEYQLNELTIDLMRRRRETESGTMDFLFVSLFQWAKARGYATFNLGLSPLAGVGEKADDPMAERAIHYIYEHLNQFYNFKGLHAFKEKFHPDWSPRYLVYPGPASLPAVALAVIRADSGDNLWAYFKR